MIILCKPANAHTSAFPHMEHSGFQLKLGLYWYDRIP